MAVEFQENHPNAPGVVRTPRTRTVVELASPVARTASANITGVDMLVTGPVITYAVISNGTTSGTTPTNDVKIQESDDNSTWSDVTLTEGAYVQLTAAAAPNLVKFTRKKRYLRTVFTIAGTSPSFTSGVVVLQ